MRTTPIVPVKEFSKTALLLKPVSRRAQVYPLVLHRPPQALDEYIVVATTASIHADLDAMIQQHPRERLAGELRPLDALLNVKLVWIGDGPSMPATPRLHGTNRTTVNLATITSATDNNLTTTAAKNKNRGSGQLFAPRTTDTVSDRKIARVLPGRDPPVFAGWRYCKGLPLGRHIRPRIAQVGPQGPPAPFASLRAKGAPLRGRVPPMDYLDNPGRCRHRRLSDHTTAENYGFRPAFTGQAAVGAGLLSCGRCLIKEKTSRAM
jgi:hypothetical protein